MEAHSRCVRVCPSHTAQGLDGSARGTLLAALDCTDTHTCNTMVAYTKGIRCTRMLRKGLGPNEHCTSKGAPSPHPSSAASSAWLACQSMGGSFQPCSLQNC